MDSNVKVAVRVRPLNKREITNESKCIVRMYDNATIIIHPSTQHLPQEKQNAQIFAFDYSMWSVDSLQDAIHCPFVDQRKVFDLIGTSIVQNAIDGYNCSVFSYGQTGSGKTMTLMGLDDCESNEGLIPRVCKELFIKSIETSNQIEISFLEIYAEEPRDLFGNNKKLVVREHPKTGTYVQGLEKILVTNYEDLKEWMDFGNSQRMTAATNMNDRSSRSHAVFTLFFTQISESKNETKISKIQLVDLAGSERITDSGVVGVHLKEAIDINKSLTTLGRVINALADLGSTTRKGGGGNKKNKFIPFRDSVLTWLLKDSLGGNSKTFMIATISPADINYDETLSTLKYAARAKDIVNTVSINANQKDALIKILRGEIGELEITLRNSLRKSLQTEEEKRKIKECEDEIDERHKILEKLTETWEIKLKRSQELRKERMSLMKKQLTNLMLPNDIQQESNILMLINITPRINFNEEMMIYIGYGHTYLENIGTFEVDIKNIYLHPTINILLNNIPISNTISLKQSDVLKNTKIGQSWKIKLL